MSGGGVCLRHGGRGVRGRCRRCGVGICDECELESGGRFCSGECRDAFRAFQGSVRDEFVVRRGRFSLVGFLRTLVISVVLLGVTGVALRMLFGTWDPGEMVAEFGRMLRLLF